MKNKSILFSLFSLIFISSIFSANIPKIVSFQGKLTNSTGAPLNDTLPFIFKIYDVSNGGTALWTENQTIAVIDGIFNAELGSVTPLNLSFDKQYWLGGSVNGDAEMLPREKIKTSPYSFSSIISDTANSILFQNVKGDTVTRTYVNDSLALKMNIIDSGIFALKTQLGIDTNSADARYSLKNSVISNFVNDSQFVSKNSTISNFINDSNFISSGKNVSLLVNDSNFVRNGTNISQLINDSGFAQLSTVNSQLLTKLNISDSIVITRVSQLINDSSFVSVAGSGITQDSGDLRYIRKSETINSDSIISIAFTKITGDTVTKTYVTDTLQFKLNISDTIAADSIGFGTVNNNEFHYLDGVSSNIQNQINSKVSETHPVFIGGIKVSDTFVVGTDTFVVLKNGYVGIGSAAPDYRLVIKGSGNEKQKIVSTTANQGAAILLQNTGNTNSPYMEWQLNPSNTDLESYLTANYSGATVKPYIMVIKANGNIGIGTQTPSDSLQIQGGIRAETITITKTIYADTVSASKFFGNGSGLTGITGAANCIDTSGADARYAFKSQANFSDSVFVADTFTVGNTAFIALKNGYVGIGTNQPSENLDVLGLNNGGVVKLGKTNVAGYSALRFLGSDDGTKYAYIEAGSSNTDDTAKLRISRYATASDTLALFEVYSSNSYFSGNVGIDTLQPSHKFTVNGDINITGNFRVNGTALSTGIGGSGTANYLPKLATATTLSNSVLYENGGFIGLGTTSPSSMLEILHTVNPKIFLNYNGTVRYFFSGTSGSLDFGNDVGATMPIRFMPGNVEKIRIDGAGNMGIGTTAPLTKLQIVGGDLTIGSNDARSLYFDDISAAKWKLNPSGYKISFSNDSGGWGERMVITNAGKVGIGTTAPAYTLEVVGNDINLTNAGNDRAYRINGKQIIGTYPGWNPDILYINGYNDWTGGVIVSKGLAVNAKLTSDSFQVFGSAVFYAQNNSGTMVFTSSGKIGIGTSSPSYSLDVFNGPARFVIQNSYIGEIMRWQGSSLGSNYQMNLSAFTPVSNNVSYYFSMQDNDGSYDTFLVFNRGNVGINIKTPLDKFQVNDSSSITGWRGRGVFSGANQSVVAGVYNDSAIIAAHSSNLGSWASLYINTQGNFVAGGNVILPSMVGIGTQTLPYALNLGTDKGILFNALTYGFAVETVTAATDYLKIKSVNAGTSSTSVDNILTVTRDGKIGLGTNAPASKLELFGSSGGILLTNNSSNDETRAISAAIQTNEIRGLSAAGLDAGQLRLSAGGGTNPNNISYIDMYGYNTRDIRIGTAGAERIRIDGSGNVGIGTTLPTQKLEVIGAQLIKPAASWSVGDSAVLYLGDGSSYLANANGTSLDIGAYHGISVKSSTANNSGDAYLFRILNYTNEKFRVDTNGNIGVGTTSPSAKLDVNGSLKIASLAQQSLTENGYIQIGGLLIQWGKYTGGANCPTVTFPIAFSQIFNINGQIEGTVGMNGGMLEIYSVTTTNFIANQRRHDAAALTNNFWWTAIGLP